MESLALVVVVIFLSVIAIGPVVLSLASNKAHPAVVIPVSLFSIYVGWWWATTVIMPAALIGVLPVTCGAAALWKAATWE